MKTCIQTCSDSLQNLWHSSGIYISELQQAETPSQTAAACGVANESLSFVNSSIKLLIKGVGWRTFQIRL